MGHKGKLSLAYAAICDPSASIRAGLTRYTALGRRKKIVCHTVPSPTDAPVPLPRAEAQLLPYLGHPWPATRRAAARDLAKMRSTRGYQQIWNMTNHDPVWTIRIAAIRILTRIYKDKFLSVLQFSLTRDPDARVRKVAIEAIAFLRRPTSVTWLANSIKFETSTTLQLSAIKALALIGDKSAASALGAICETHKSDDVRAAAVKALNGLKRYRRQSRPVLARVLKQDRSGKVRAAALRALSRDRSATACQARAERINDPDAEVRQTVVEQLARCPARIARPALAAAAREDKDARVRLAAVKLLIKGGAKKAKEILIALLQNDKDARIRKRAFKAVITLPPKDRASPLAEVAKQDSDVELRRAAVRALAKLPAKDAVAALEVALSRDREADVRADAATALSNFSDAAAYRALQQAASSDTSDKVRKIAARGAAKSPAQKAFVDALLPQTIDSSPNVRLNAVTKLCALQVPRTYRALVRALWVDVDASVRTATAKCFAEIDHPLIDIGLSVAHSTETDGGVIRTVEMSQKQRMERLVRLLEEVKSRDVEKRVDAVKVLQPSPNNQVRQALERLLKKDTVPRVRRAAAFALARYRDQRALQKLMQASQQEQDPKTRRKIGVLYNKLRKWWAKGRKALDINKLIKRLRSRKRRTRVAAARSLGALRDRRAFQPLRTAAKNKDPALRHAAIVALATFGDVTIVAKSARKEKVKAVREQLIQLNFLRKATPEKVIESLVSNNTGDVFRAIEAAGIKQMNKVVPYIVRLALSHPSPGVRRAAVRTLALYDLPLAQWAIRVAAINDASKKLRKIIWRWAVFTNAGGST